MTPNLLVTKLYIPPARKDLVPRPRLVQILDEGWRQGKKLALVSASPGYGKTTLVSEWVCGLQSQCAWLTLDRTDNDPVRFPTYLIAALQQIDGRIGATTLGIMQSPQPLPPEAVLTALINEIAVVTTPFILVLDDYHVIEAMPIHQWLDFLVEHQPQQMHLVIVTREDPPLPFARLRARGQMVEIRQDNLRFLPEECADFLHRVMDLNLSVDDINALERRTEGWIAGLQLAALSMQGRADLPGFIKAFSGSSHYVLDYLIEEVFERQTAEEQDFLYHHLFADLLRQRLQSTEMLSENELHRLASRWFAAEGFVPEAIHHALSASDWEKAAGLIRENSVHLLRRGELMTLLGWLKALPDEVVRSRPQLCRDYGWALTLTGNLDAAGPYLDCAEGASRGDDEHLGQVIVAQAYLARAFGDYSRAITLSRQALKLVAERDILHRSLVTFTLDFALLNAGRGSGAGVSGFNPV